MRKLYPIPLAMRAFAAFVVAILVLTPARVALADAALDKLYQAAKAEGKVSLVSAPNDLLRKSLTEGFTKRFPGIDFEYSGMSGNASGSKIKSEARAGVYSVDALIAGSNTPILNLKPVGLVRPLDPEIVSSDARDPTKWQDGGLAWGDKDRTTIGMTLVILTPVISNTDQVKPGEVLSDKDLLDPKWKGRIISGSPLVPSAANILYRYYYDRYGEEFIRALQAQEVMVTSNLRQIVDFVSKGRYSIGLAPSGQSINLFLKQGVKTLGAKDGGNWKDPLIATPGFGTLSMPTNVPHPNAAKLLVNWLLTQEGQTAVVKGLGYPSRRTDVSQDPVPEFLRSVPGRKYLDLWTEDFLKSPNQIKMMEFLNEIKFGQQ